jgi:hypothetical protein
MLVWQRMLNLSDWRIVKDSEPSKYMAEVYKFEDIHKKVNYKVGSDFGRTKVTPTSLEDTAIHEMLHIRLHTLIKAVSEYGEDSDTVAEKEHEVIVVLAPLLRELMDYMRKAK